MKVNRSRSLCIEIYKLINNINPTYMNEIFKLRKISRAVCSNYKLNLDVPTINQVSFGGKSLRYYRPKIWNSLSFHIKSSENLEAFKILQKTGMMFLESARCVNIIKYQQIILTNQRPIIDPCNIWVGLSEALSICF